MWIRVSEHFVHNVFDDFIVISIRIRFSAPNGLAKRALDIVAELKLLCRKKPNKYKTKRVRENPTNWLILAFNGHVIRLIVFVIKKDEKYFSDFFVEICDFDVSKDVFGFG